MIIRAIDENGDWIFGKGKNSYNRENLAIMENIQTRLMLFKNDCFFDLDTGIDWWNLLGSKDLQKLLFEIKQTIINSYGVAELLDFDSNFSLPRILSLSYKVKLINEEELSDTTEVLAYA